VKIVETRLDDMRSSDIEEPPRTRLSDEVQAVGSQGLCWEWGSACGVMCAGGQGGRGRTLTLRRRQRGDWGPSGSIVGAMWELIMSWNGDWDCLS
jgi:hypothetical protein